MSDIEWYFTLIEHVQYPVESPTSYNRAFDWDRISVGPLTLFADMCEKVREKVNIDYRLCHSFYWQHSHTISHTKTITWNAGSGKDKANTLKRVLKYNQTKL